MEYNYSLTNSGTLNIDNLLSVKEAITIDDNVILKVELIEQEPIITSTVDYIVIENEEELTEEYADYIFLNEINTNRILKVYYKIIVL